MARTRAPDWFALLQRSIGNHAVARAMSASAPTDAVEPLEPRLRASLETRLGADLSRLRVHHGPGAAKDAERHGALALTRGWDVVLGGSVTPADHDVIAHEAAHAVQQTGPPVPSGVPTAEIEAEARRAASLSAPVTITFGAAPRGAVQRLMPDEPPRRAPSVGPDEPHEAGDDYSWKDFSSDVIGGLKGAALGLLEPLLIVADFGQMGAALVTYYVAPEKYHDVEWLSGMGRRIAGGTSAVRAGAVVVLAIPTGGGVVLVDNVAQVYEKDMTPKEARSFLVQGAVAQVASTALASGTSRVQGQGWTGRGTPAPTPVQVPPRSGGTAGPPIELPPRPLNLPPPRGGGSIVRTTTVLAAADGRVTVTEADVPVPEPGPWRAPAPSPRDWGGWGGRDWGGQGYLPPEPQTGSPVEAPRPASPSAPRVATPLRLPDQPLVPPTSIQAPGAMNRPDVREPATPPPLSLPGEARPAVSEPGRREGFKALGAPGGPALLPGAGPPGPRLVSAPRTGDPVVDADQMLNELSQAFDNLNKEQTENATKAGFPETLRRLREVLSKLRTARAEGGMKALEAAEEALRLQNTLESERWRLGRPLPVEKKVDPFNAASWAEYLRGLSPGDRMAAIQSTIDGLVAPKVGLVFDQRVSARNAGPKRRIYWSENRRQYFSVDWLHGNFEACDEDGDHLGEADFDLKITGPKQKDHSIKVR